ncbi:MAG: AbrB/MazE/SpoVT family DNA-binding domain-containing protein [Candidatus Tumulicola sp.]
MTVTLSRWGNSLAVRIPKDALDGADLHEGDRLDIVMERGRLVLVPQAIRPSLDALIAGITPENLHKAAFDNVVGAEAW